MGEQVAVNASRPATPSVPDVALAASSFAPHKGGVEEVVQQLALEQRASGASPTVLTMRWPKRLPRHQEVEGIPVRRFLYRAPEGDLPHRALARAAQPVTVAQIRRQLRRTGAQVVHIHCVSSAAWFVGQAARRAGLPLVVTLHGELTMDATGVYERSPFLRSTLRHLLSSADSVTAVSLATLEEAENWAGVDLGERGTVIYNGVRVSEFANAVPEVRLRPYVFAVGRHVKEKGFDLLVDAFAGLASDPSFGWDLVLAGDGPEHQELRAKVELLGLERRVELTGETSRRQTASWFRGASAFVLPSRHEPFGIVNLEAMASGVPIVASAVGGVPEFVTDGEVGMLVPSESATAIEAALRRLHDDRAFARRLGEAGRVKARLFDWAQISARYARVYEDAIARHRGGSRVR
jgi:glycogen(starch) synthase